MTYRFLISRGTRQLFRRLPHPRWTVTCHLHASRSTANPSAGSPGQDLKNYTSSCKEGHRLDSIEGGAQVSTLLLCSAFHAHCISTHSTVCILTAVDELSVSPTSRSRYAIIGTSCALAGCERGRKGWRTVVSLLHVVLIRSPLNLRIAHCAQCFHPHARCTVAYLLSGLRSRLLAERSRAGARGRTAANTGMFAAGGRGARYEPPGKIQFVGIYSIAFGRASLRLDGGISAAGDEQVGYQGQQVLGWCLHTSPPPLMHLCSVCWS